MPVTAPAPGPAPVAPLLPVLAGRPADRVVVALPQAPAADTVSLSPEALLRLALEAPAVPMGQLGTLLQEFGEIERLTTAAAPLLLGEMAGEIGGAAEALGSRMGEVVPALVALPAMQADASGYDRDALPSGTATPPDPAAPVQHLREDAAAMLQGAVDTLGLMQRRLHRLPAGTDDAPVRDAAASAAFDPAEDVAWCEAQIAAALGQVGTAIGRLDVEDQAARGTAGRAWRPALPRMATGRPGWRLLPAFGVAAALLLLGRPWTEAACAGALAAVVAAAWRPRLLVALRR